jgi:succinate dehydrogenase/fumarate reductase flavoprotein subunit
MTAEEFDVVVVGFGFAGGVSAFKGFQFTSSRGLACGSQS